MIENSHIMTISDSKFTNDTGRYGGAIDFYHDQGNEIVTITNTKSENNSATFDGGAVHGDSPTVFIKNSSFIGNSVRWWGRALHLSQLHAKFDASSFLENCADRGGGGGEHCL